MTQARRDWYAWHGSYDDPESWQAQRLAVVQERIRDALDTAPDGPVSVLAMVAGQGRDLLPVLASHPRRHEVTARLVELDPRNAEAARVAARDSGLSGVQVVTGDAALVDHYRDLAPADLVLAVGLFPHIAMADIERIVRHAPALTRSGGMIIWSSHRRSPDPVPQITSWFADEGFRQVWISEPGCGYCVGVHRYQGQPRPVVAGTKLFTFVGINVLYPQGDPVTG